MLIRAALPVLGIAGWTLVAPVAAHAGCIGSPRFQMCTSTSTGDTYNVTRLGKMIDIEGIKAATGQPYTQHSLVIGHTTYTDGLDAHARPWFETRHDFTAHSYTIEGTDPIDKPFSYVCDSISGCN
ncbi:hypothetical protein [Komagataeibacter swingsii]|uniref:Uncharacterized protein n=1 Tax=Komagataeibacter swingsii TaxID=215220 RepID=A0A2V4S2Y1_9PROT|nr:hypothetical protein [Komagataeibacter swingsii]PYD69489.1 hypothetical protein CFR76_09155 [Komagataeibacter swingsii]GBQ59594.1 hypothetical protein AA16373_1621 [Komagataeibacter swingsii DSM 16373]